MSEHNAPSGLQRSESPDIEPMRAAVAAVLTPGRFLPQEELEEQRLLLRRHIKQLIPVVEELARIRPVESVLRAVALDEVKSARVLLALGPEPGLRSAIQHLKHSARELRALCDRHDMLTGLQPLGAS